MANNSENINEARLGAETWQLNALTEALGELTLTVNDSLSIGRGSDNDVVLGSKQVSRNHAVLSVLNGELYVKDLASSNGSFINGQRIEGNKSKHLKADDHIGFASFTFQVLQPNATEVVESPQEVMSDQIVDTAPTIAQPVIEDSGVEEPVIKETIMQEVLPASDGSETTAKAEDSGSKAEKPVEQPISENSLSVEDNEEHKDYKETAPVTLNTDNNLDSDIDVDTDVDIVQPTSISPLASDTETADTPAQNETAPSKEQSTEALTGESVIKAASAMVINEESTQKQMAHQDTSSNTEHDKTTTTALQEEADPDVLRAKQAATAQFSGTANLGQPRDLGTEGNNAMDQAIQNPATTNESKKKSSGVWFIWLFFIILIIGVAVWFTKGGI